MQRSSTAYRQRGPAPLRAAVGAADRLSRGTVRRQLSRRSLWQAVPTGPARRPDEVRRLALTVDLDYQADTDALPALVAMLERCGARMSVCSVGALVEADASPYEAAVAAGHELVNHTMTHPDNAVLDPDREFWHLTAEQMTQQVGEAQDVFGRRLGVRPTGFRTPHFKDAHRLTGVLTAFPELRYVSSALASRSPLGAEPYLASRPALAGEDLSHLFAAADPADATDLLQIPLTPCPAHRWSPYCSWHGIRRPASSSGAGMHSLEEWSGLWDTMLERAEHDGLAVVYLDPHDLVRDQETSDVFEAMLARAVAGGWDVTTLGAVEAAYRPLAGRAT